MAFARTACSRCRAQKMKCSREQPICARCLRAGLDCEFPAPPDRKLLATAREAKRKKNREDDRAVDLPYKRMRSSWAIHSSFNIIDDTNRKAYVEINDTLSKQLRLFLLDVYFSCMYNSSLLFHRPTFLLDVEAGLVPGYVLLALYATATIFLPPGSSLVKSHGNLLDQSGNIQELGRRWASLAAKEVLQDIDQPCLTSVQACEALALYWFSAGDSRRNTMFSGIAYKAACVLGLDRSKFSPSSKDGLIGISKTSWLEDEIERRCFWAVWLTNCINSEHYTVGTSINERIKNLPLPMDDLSFHRTDGPPPSNTLTNILALSDGRHQQASVMAELVKLMMIWAAIGDHLEARKSMSSKECLADLFEIDNRLSEWASALPRSLSYSKRNLHEQLVVNHQPVFTFVHALHYQCRLVLHSSTVPQFSGLLLHQPLSAEVIGVSARVALKNAQAISELGSDLIALDWDFAQVAPFVGYCMYVSASVHLVFLFSRDQTLATLAHGKLLSNLRVLKSMKVYWNNLERLWARINILYEAQTSRIRSSSNNDASGPIDQQDEVGDLEVIDQLARKKRDSGNLAEPLARSVLQYNLRLRPNTSSQDQHSQAADLERRIYSDPLVRIIDEELARQRHTQAGPSSTWASNASLETTEAQCNTAPYSTGFTDVGSSDHLATTVPGFLNDGLNDWWQVDLGDLTQTMLSYSDLFDFGT